MLVVRVHHCLGDGLTLVQLLLCLAGIDAHPADVDPPHPPPATHAGDLLERAAKDIVALGRLLLLPSDDSPPFCRPPSRGKRAAWSRAIPFDRVQRIACAAHARTDDVLMASVTAAVRSHLARHGGLRRGSEIHAIVPVVRRGGAEGSGHGDQFGLAFAGLPLALESPLERVHEMKRRMDTIKASPEADVAFAILGAAARASAFVEHLLVEFFSRKASLLVTSIEGPPAPFELGGQVVDAMTVWAPTAGHVALGITLVRYAGSVRMGVASDVAIVPDPESLVGAFEEDLDDLTRIGACCPVPRREGLVLH